MPPRLLPLRVPAGWVVGWNTFWDMEVPEDGFGGSSLLYCLRHDQRLVIDVEWRPEDDPNGHYHYYVQRQPASGESAPEPEIRASGESRSRFEVAAWVNRWLARGILEAPGDVVPPVPGEGAAGGQLHPLRIPAAWTIQRNALTERGVDGDEAPASGLLLFRAVDEKRGFRIDAGWNSSEGYTLEALQAEPSREARPGSKALPPRFDGDVRVAHRSSTPQLAELVARLEKWLTHIFWWDFHRK